MKSIRQIKNLKGKKVLVRVDFNVPMKGGHILDDFRIRKALPTVKFLLKKGAKIILITHLGEDGSESLAPIIKRFFELSKCSKSQVSFFDNIRKFGGEVENYLSFAKKLSKMGDIYVNEAFSVSHREHASIVGLPKYLPSYAGLQLEEEVKNLSKVFKKPKHPFLLILGGKKFETKLPVIKRFLKTADDIFIGGALASQVFKEEGYETGTSLVEDKKYGLVSLVKNHKIMLPRDVVVLDGERKSIVSPNNLSKKENIIDIGPEAVKDLENKIKKAKMILWNGPLGKSSGNFNLATYKIIRAVARRKVVSIIGGGDTIDLISKLKMEKRFTFVSTGGGATLDFLANGTLPGIKALK